MEITQIPINEVFSQRTDVYTPNNWTVTAVPDVAANGSFVDALCFVGGWSPHPLPPQSPLSGTEIFINNRHGGLVR